jgi:hypothetical protein
MLDQQFAVLQTSRDTASDMMIVAWGDDLRYPFTVAGNQTATTEFKLVRDLRGLILRRDTHRRGFIRQSPQGTMDHDAGSS